MTAEEMIMERYARLLERKITVMQKIRDISITDATIRNDLLPLTDEYRELESHLDCLLTAMENK